MVGRNSETEMPGGWHFSRVDTLDLKSQIVKKIGRSKAGNYFNLLTGFLSLKIHKPEFDKLCIRTIGRENVHLHNNILGTVIRNASLSKTPPLIDNELEGVSNGYQRSNLQSLCKGLPKSPRKCRTPNLGDDKLRDLPSPLGPNGKSHSTVYEDAVPKVQEQQSATELLSLGSRPPDSVEDGEEVDQATRSPSIYSRSPVRAPLGITLNAKRKREAPWNESASAYETCYCQGELPDSSSLRKRLKHKLEIEGLDISVDCVDLLNNSLSVYMKRLIKPCLELAGLRSGQKVIVRGHNMSMAYLNGMQPVRYASMLDFLVAMEMSPLILGAEWPTQFEKPAATTVGAKRGVKKEEGILSTIQPKRLFKDGEEPVAAKKPLRPRRVVSSRYNQIGNRRSGNLEVNDKRRVSNEQLVDSCKNQKSESRVKKKWEIPSEVIIAKGETQEESPKLIDKMMDELPKIRTVRVWGESPRGSGPAKRVAELMGSYQLSQIGIHF